MTDPGQAQMRNTVQLFGTELDWTDRLADELCATFADASVTVLSPGWVTLSSQSPDLELPIAPVAFARQSLPKAEPISAESIRALAQASVQKILDSLLGDRAHFTGDLPWMLHVWSIPRPGGSAGTRRCELLQQAILAGVKDRHRATFRRYVSSPAPQQVTPACHLIQVALISANQGFVSVLSAEEWARQYQNVQALMGGRYELPEDKSAPSRAFAKLVEACEVMGRQIKPGESCIDLGASPGGWTHVAVNAGARVIAVDRSPLADSLMEHPSVCFVPGDAFTFELDTAKLPGNYSAMRPTDGVVDWLLSDVIAYPDKIMTLLDRWLMAPLASGSAPAQKSARCRRFCITVKFQGESEYHKLLTIKQMLAGHVRRYWVRRLNANKNEVTLFGEV